MDKPNTTSISPPPRSELSTSELSDALPKLPKTDRNQVGSGEEQKELVDDDDGEEEEEEEEDEDDSETDDDLIDLETRPGTPIFGVSSSTGLPAGGAPGGGIKHSLLATALGRSSSDRGRKRETESVISSAGAGAVGVGKEIQTASKENLQNPRDPLRALPSSVAVRIFLQLDVRSLARCDRVCKRWRKSATLNYGECLSYLWAVVPPPPLPLSGSMCRWSFGR